MKLKPSTEIVTVTAANIVPTMQLSNDSEITGPERVSSMSAQVGSINVLRDTSDMERTALKGILQKLNLSGMKDWETSLQKATQNLIHEFTCIFSQDLSVVWKPAKACHDFNNGFTLFYSNSSFINILQR